MISEVARDTETADFFDFLADGVFPLRRCDDCAGFSEPQASQCSSCGSVSLGWAPASRRARVVSWAVVHRPGQAEPSLIAIGELEEGPWWWAEVIDPPALALQPGDDLEVDFARPSEHSEVVPVFRRPVARQPKISGEC